jgi:hypothetical protein
MSGAAEVELTFAGEKRLFRQRIGAQRAVQEATDCGPMELLRRFGTGDWRVDDLRAPIYRGLIDGDMKADKAAQLMIHNFDDLPKAQFVPLARAIVGIGIIGVPEEEEDGDDAGEPAGETVPSPRSPEERSPSEPSSGSPPER